MRATQTQERIIPLHEKTAIHPEKLRILADHNRNLVQTAKKERQQHKKLINTATNLLAAAVPVYNDLDQPATEWIIPDAARNQLLATLFLNETESSVEKSKN